MRVRLRQPFAFPVDDRSLHVEPADELGPLIGVEWRTNAGRCHARGRYRAPQARCTAFFGFRKRSQTRTLEYDQAVVENNPGASPNGPENDAAHAQLVAVAEDWSAAIVSNDAARIAHFMTDEWVIVSESGVSPREHFLSVVESGELTHSAMDVVSEPRVRIYGDTAVLTARVTNTAHHLGRRFDADEWTTDVFVKRDGRWLCALSHITPAAPD